MRDSAITLTEVIPCELSSSFLILAAQQMGSVLILHTIALCHTKLIFVPFTWTSWPPIIMNRFYDTIFHSSAVSSSEYNNPVASHIASFSMMPPTPIRMFHEGLQSKRREVIYIMGPSHLFGKFHASMSIDGMIGPSLSTVPMKNHAAYSTTHSS